MTLPVDGSQLVSAVGRMQQKIGRPLDIVHTYHRWYDVFPTAAETVLARAGHEMFINWEPVDARGKPMSWSAIAAGKHDEQIDALAQRLRSMPEVLLSFSHEPELDYGKHGDAAAFATAFRHIHDRLIRDGATNIRFVWNVMGLSSPTWLARYPVLWPGASYVDWIAWDPYNTSACRGAPWRSFAQIVGPFYGWLESHGMGDKPFMLAEYGTVEKSGDPGAKAAWFAAIPSQLSAFPNLRALVYFDVPAPPANCDWLTTTSIAADQAFGRYARSPVFG